MASVLVDAPVPPRVEVRDIVKTFPGVVALRDVGFAVQPGEIHALLGENGAGKSTLSKIIGGILTPDSGELLLDGVPLGRITETEANRLGIGVVHQEGSLVSQLSVGDNIFAGRQPLWRFGMTDRRALRRASLRLLDQLGVQIDPDALVGTLSAAQRQVVEIAKALSHDLRLLILDEPTAALSLLETEALFRVARRLAAQGVSIIYVSHRLAEIFELCDRVTVLKDGRFVGTEPVSSIDTRSLIHMMVGRELHFERDDAPRMVGEIILEARGVVAAPFVADASITVRKGEIVCLAGLVGAGRTEFCEVLFGVRRRSGGSVTLGGRPFDPRSPGHAIRAGIGMVCEDRKTSGLFLDLDIKANIAVTVLSEVSSGIQLSERKIEALSERFLRALNISAPSVHQQVGNLSGGNQQKVLLAKWLAAAPGLLIVDEPTRGVDVGARSEIYRILRSLAASGVGLLVVSSELPEVLALADRIVVMADGVTVGELDGSTASEITILQLATQHARPEPAMIGAE